MFLFHMNRTNTYNGKLGIGPPQPLPLPPPPPHPKKKKKKKKKEYKINEKTIKINFQAET